jgi:hypothetical protein
LITRGPKGERRPADVDGIADHVMRVLTGEIGCFVFSMALTGAALSEDAPLSQKVKDMAHVMLLCYNAGAIKYAVQTCEPAASIITAVYGRCDSLERDFKHAVELDHRNNPLFSDALLNEIRKSVEPKLYALILDTRASSENKCP